jgi:Tol biopolymer transport system component
VAATLPNSVPAMAGTTALKRWKSGLYPALGAMFAALLILVGYRFIEARQSPRQMHLTGLRQLTSNGREKDHLLSDGTHLYFGQEQDGRFGLASMAEAGGPIRTLWNPPMSVFPEDISPDHKELLALTSLSVERERAMWLVPLNDGEPHPLTNLSAHSAAWSPDGKTIAFATGNKIYLMASDGPAVRLLKSFPDIPDILRWSADGHRLRSLLFDATTNKPAYWELTFSDAMLVAPLSNMPYSIDADGGNWSRNGTDDGVFAAAGDGKNESLWLIQHSNRFWEPAVKVSEFPTGLGRNGGIAYDLPTSRIYLLSEFSARSLIVRVDPQSGEFRHILPGISGVSINYSKDGNWIAYLVPDEDVLWIGRADGTGLRQITDRSKGRAELPRWSPDGKSIAYMMKRPGNPWRIFIAPRDGGEPREASEGIDNQGAPTWSPDGKYLAYANVECQATHNCAVHRIDVSTSRVQTLPGSDGLGTARWSPDGKYIAALQPERHELSLFDTNTQKWHKLADGMDGTDLSWSRDSKAVYTNVPGAAARIVRLSIADGSMSTIVNLRSQDDFNLADISADLGFSLAPDDAVLLRRKMSATEIYSYTLQSK